MKDKKNSIVSTYVRLAKKLKRDIRMKDLQEEGITKDMVTHHFGSLFSGLVFNRTEV
jgi:hypothetical protein